MTQPKMWINLILVNPNETCSQDTSCYHLLHLDSLSLSSELQDMSIVESIKPESVPDFEDLLQLDSTHCTIHFCLYVQP